MLNLCNKYNLTVLKKILFLIALTLVLFGNAHSQSFPNPVTLSTGQGAPGALDPIWVVSPWYTASPPNPMGLTYIPGLINNNCAPGAWVDPAALPPPVNNGNWITGSDGSCANNALWGYRYFRLTLDLPPDCNGNSLATPGNYVLNFVGYVDNTITDVFINGNSTGISGGAFSAGSQLSITLVGPWVPGINYIDVLVLNFQGGSSNPYGLLLVADDVANATTDTDNDGVSNLNDQCTCSPGSLADGCPAPIVGDTVICENESATLTATGTGTYLWSTGETSSSITVSPIVSSTYNVVVTTSSGYGDSASIDVTVKALPTISVAGDTSLCAGETTTLTASGGGTYIWDTGSTNSSITVTPLSTSTYEVTVTDNGCTDSVLVTVSVNPIPIATFTNTTVCRGDSTSFTDASTVSSGNVIDWTWDFGNGASANALPNPALIFDPAGIYTVVLVVTSDFGCMDTTSQNIEIYPNPFAEFSSQPVCQGITTNFTDLSTISGTGTIATWAWDFGDLTAIDPAQNSQHGYISAGNYNVTLTITSDNACTDETTIQTVVYALPDAGFTATDVCLNQPPTEFTDTSQIQGDVVTMWDWDFGDLSSSVAPNPSHTYSASGIYGVQLEVTSANGCSDVVVQQVEVYSVPQVSILPDVTSGCLPLCVNFIDISTVVNGSITGWNWDFGNGSTSNAMSSSNCYNEEGFYDVTLIATSSNGGCKDTMTINNMIEVWPNPVAGFSAEPQPTTLLNTLINFTDNSIGMVDQWNWSFYNNDSVTLLGVNDTFQNLSFIFPTDTGKYPVHLAVTTINGCSDDTTLFITILDDYVLHVPSAFTPNGDGLNETFFPTGIGIDENNVEMFIFDRWGDLIYETSDMNTPWDGTANEGSEPAQSDVYVWLLNTTDDVMKKHQYVGQVTLIR